MNVSTGQVAQADDLLGDAAHQQPREAGAAVRAQDNQVDLLLLGGTHDLVGRIADQQQMRMLHVGGRLDGLEHAPDLGIGRVRQSVVTLAHVGGQRLFDVDDQQRGVVLASQRGGMIQGRVAGMREVGGKEDFLGLHGVSPWQKGAME